MIVSTMQAASGVWRTLRVNGRAWRLRVPAGVDNGQTLRLAGAAPGGSDLLVRLRVAHPEPEVVDSLRRRFSAAWAA